MRVSKTLVVLQFFEGGIGKVSCEQLEMFANCQLTLPTTTKSFPHTHCQSIELLNHQLHILGPGEGETSRAHQVGHTLGVVVLQERDMVQRAAGIGGSAESEARGQARRP